MNTEELIKKINNKASEERESAERIELDKRDKFVRKLYKIIGYGDRINVLCTIAQTLIDNRIPLGSVRHDGCGFVHYEFQTDGIFHGLGFVINSRERIVSGIGIIGGGCDGYSFTVNRHGISDVNLNKPLRYNQGCSIDYPWNVWSVANKVDKFIDGFDEFERRVLKYAEEYVNE